VTLRVIKKKQSLALDCLRKLSSDDFILAKVEFFAQMFHILNTTLPVHQVLWHWRLALIGRLWEVVHAGIFYIIFSAGFRSSLFESKQRESTTVSVSNINMIRAHTF